MVTMIEKSVPGFDLINQKIGEAIKAFKVLSDLHISYDDLNEHCNIDIGLRSDSDKENTISISCIDVSKYTANFSDIGELFISGLQLFSKNYGQMDRVAWELSDYEDGKIVVLCREMRMSVK